jgi:hypothetical protein
MLGGLLATLVKKTAPNKDIYKDRQETGILFGSGLVAGDALIGVASAGLIAASKPYKEFYDKYESILGRWGEPVSLICIFGLAVIFYGMIRGLSRE